MHKHNYNKKNYSSGVCVLISLSLVLLAGFFILVETDRQTLVTSFAAALLHAFVCNKKAPQGWEDESRRF